MKGPILSDELRVTRKGRFKMGYWSKGLEEIFREFNSSSNGLSGAEANARLKQYGLNDIPKRKEKAALSLLLSQMKDLLVITLAIVSVISFFTGGETEAIIILVIVVVNVLVGFFQEYKSENALRKLALLIRYRVKVLRDDKVVEVDTRNIVPGDVILLETGERIPADLRIIEADELEIDESVVTGESFPVHKSSDIIVAEKLEPQRMLNMAFLGTLVVNGKGKGIVISTGMKTTLGRVATYLKLVEPETNYQRNIKSFSRFLIKCIIVGMSFIFLVNTLTVKSFIDSALFSLALAVGIIPESLPIIITIGLSRGAMLMSRSGVIVKKLSVIEDLGNMDVLCADKTGTLTQNKIALHDYIDLDGNRNEELIELASHCVSVMEVGGEIERTVTGSPMDVAIVEYANKQGISRSGSEIVELIPFNYTRRRMSVITRDGDRYLIICKGAPESLLPVCSTMRTDNKVSRLNEDRVQRLFEDLSGKGYRVLGLGVREIEKKEDYSASDEHDLTFLGFLCFLDPLKPTAEQSIQELRELGVEIKILTGDNPIVTKARAEEVGMKVELLTGKDVDGMDDESLRKAVEKTNVFARLTPEQKARIIQALRKNDHVVGFLGDGVNDAPPLKSADLGISVDEAVDIAKEAADIILTESSLDVISKGILEGRTTFANTTKYILNTVSANLGNMASLAVISVVLDFLPMLPFQVLLTNLISDGPLLSISTDRVDEEELRRPKNWDIGLIGRFSAFFGGISSAFDFMTFGLALLLVGGNIALFRTCWFIESTLSEIVVTFAIRTKKRFYQSRPSRTLLGISIMCGLLTVLLPYSQASAYLEFYPPPMTLLLTIGGILLLYFMVDETVKKRFWSRYVPVLEQVVVPRKRIELSRVQRLVQGMVATICLRSESEISIDSLFDDLKSSVDYPISQEQVVRNLDRLRRFGLVTIDWRERTVRREELMKEYVMRQVTSEFWPVIVKDWQRVSSTIQAKYNQVNPEYQGLLVPEALS